MNMGMLAVLLPVIACRHVGHVGGCQAFVKKNSVK